MPADTPTSVGGLVQDKITQRIGRFAPSPTGDLHFGSLLAAMASYCATKNQSGLWLLRIDDIDGPRSVAGSADTIQRTLEQYGLEWDGPVHWQSQRLERYQQALSELVSRQRIFACSCSRRSLPPGEIYPGNCRSKTVAVQSPVADYHRADHALRCRLTGQVHFTDAMQGVQNITLEKEVGDIILWRRDNLVSYALACAIDDAETVTHVVRGADLLSSTAAQIGTMQALGLTVPEYAHIPVAIDINGDKLSKHSKAEAISNLPTLTTLQKAWQVLGQKEIQALSIADFWRQAVNLWQSSYVPVASKVSI